MSLDSETPRLAAALARLPHYEGRECPKCAKTLRYTSSGQCVACVKARGSASTDRIRALLRGESETP